jgi:hypothetical protein
VVAAVVVFGGIFAVSQVSDASTRSQRQAAAARKRGGGCSAAQMVKVRTNGSTSHPGDGQNPADTPAWVLRCKTPPSASASASAGTGAGSTATPTPGAASSSAAAGGGNAGGAGNSGGKTINGLQVLGTDCSGSQLPPHTGFQVAPACVSTSFGEVSAAANNPSLLITQAPRSVKVGQAFTLQVSTRNLVRDRFLGAAAGGYYLESAFLTADGLTRGHFHTACRMLANTTSAPQPDAVPAFFVATEDGKGSATPDTVTIQVTGMPTAGTAQCASWAGDGSHRIPMMQNAKETPAFDAVRITVQ